MKLSVELSMYPLTQSFKPPILEFIHSLEGLDGIAVKRNTMSTQIFGEYGLVMDVLKDKIEKAMQTDPSVVMVMKMVNSDLEN
jgi:uncharacterized protein YqgV (UPF0045/DUF77 family)